MKKSAGVGASECSARKRRQGSLGVLREPRREREHPGAVITRHAVADMLQVALLTGMRLGEGGLHQLAGRNHYARTKVYRCLKCAAECAKVMYGQRIDGGFSFHDMRHTATMRLLHAGADVATVSEVLGHSQKTMTVPHAHARLESKRRAVSFLEGLDGGVDEEKDRALQAIIITHVYGQLMDVPPHTRHLPVCIALSGRTHYLRRPTLTN